MDWQIVGFAIFIVSFWHILATLRDEARDRRNKK